jgi:hypothetical protein
MAEQQFPKRGPAVIMAKNDSATFMDSPIPQDSKDGSAATASIMAAITESAKKATPQDTGIPFDFSKVHLHIGIPCYGGLIYTHCMTSLIQFFMLAQQLGLSWSLETMVNESLINRARNGLMAKMMHNSDATHFMFIDADIQFDPHSIVQMIVEDVDIISGIYPKKTLPINYNVNLEKTTKVRGPIYTVYTAATGFLLFKRKVYEDLMRAHPEEKYIDDVGLGKQYEPFLYNIFSTHVDKSNTISNGHLLSEDWAFCIRAKALGYDIWADSRISLNHIGTYVYEGDISKLQIRRADGNQA